MNEIIPFQFENSAIRIQLDQTGLPWFSANDVCAVLEFSNARQALETHVDSEDVQKFDTLTAGGRQRQNYVSESGVYALIFGSTKSAAKRFKRWITSEVLPTLRTTGSYTIPHSLTALPEPIQERVSAILSLGDWIAKVPGVRPGIAAAMTLDCIEGNTNIDPGAMRHALPPANEPMCTLNATQLGTHLKLSARATNQLLATVGFQRRNARNEWELTKAGEVWAQALPFARNSHSGYQILWNPAVAEQLQHAA